MELFEERACHELRLYEDHEYSDQPDRLMRLMLRLPALRALNPDIMEELFFAGLIGNVQIDSIIPYILKMDTGEYSLQTGLNEITTNSIVDSVYNAEMNKKDCEDSIENDSKIDAMTLSL
jgi:hypothetical protein